MIRSTKLLLGLTCCILSACGTSGPQAFRVQGEVTFQGKPVPAGRIDFIPDARRGNSAMSGFAKIHDGMYDTSESGVGFAGGPMTVLVTGYAPEPGRENSNQMLFVDYQLEEDFPPTHTTFDIAVPESAAVHAKSLRPGSEP
jgi:hypothetical protein